MRFDEASLYGIDRNIKQARGFPGVRRAIGSNMAGKYGQPYRLEACV
jgi:hypothetical protein